MKRHSPRIVAVSLAILIGPACFGMIVKNRELWITAANVDEFPIDRPLDDPPEWATDWVDGFWARRYGQVTVLGRIFDPFVDKVIICGAFIFLVASPESKVTAWMAVVVTGREMLVTVIRSFFEQQGTDFSAKMAGKLKMVLQCVAVVASLYLLSHTDRSAPAPAWLETTVTLSLWAAILITIYSGAEYVVVAARLMRS